MRLQVSMAVRRCECAADARKADRACEPDDEGRLEDGTLSRDFVRYKNVRILRYCVS